MKLLIASLALVSSSSAFAALIYDFEGVGYDPGDALPPPWISSQLPTNPVDFVAVGQFGAIGTLNYIPDITPGDSAGLSATTSAITTDAALLQHVIPDGTYPALFLESGIVDSTDDFPERNNYGFSFTDSLGSTLVEVAFTPSSVSLTPESDTGTWDISYRFGGAGLFTASPFFATEDTIFDYGIVFADDRIILSQEGATIASGGGGYNTALVNGGSIGFSTEIGAEGVFGTNYMLFDNITAGSAVPETSTALLSGVAALGLLRRRRNS